MIACAIRPLWHQDVPKQFNFQTCFDPLMICARDVSRANIIPEGVVDLEQFITNPRAIKRQLPLKPRILSASSDFDGPGVLWLKRCVHDGGIRTLSKVDQIIQRRRLPTTTEVYECLCLAVDFVNRSQLGIESPEILPIRLISVRVANKSVLKMPLRENRLCSGENR